ncbi:PTPLA-domain-containing protein [Xylariaceae sp. FL0255]|nr:PTPLA-domain-containing protein [Xylariaceae sp. FL0255]
MKSTYLLVYNVLSLIAWAILLARAILFVTASGIPISALVQGKDTLRESLLPYVTVLQSLAGIEVLHAAAGIVRSSPATTALQIGGRNLVIWTVARRFPEVVFGSGAGRWGFVGCVLAWAASDVLRYAFFVVSLRLESSSASKSGKGKGGLSAWALAWLKWLRYTAFIVLYPIGFLSEASLVYICLVQAQHARFIYRTYLLFGLLAYIPAGYILFTYMFSQRRRALSHPTEMSPMKGAKGGK